MPDESKSSTHVGFAKSRDVRAITSFFDREVFRHADGALLGGPGPFAIALETPRRRIVLASTDEHDTREFFLLVKGATSATP